MTTISVIIPMYNSERTIEKALDSVVGQTYPAHYQIIVVDDGSSDRSAELVERYAEAHPSADIRLIRQSNGGVSSARNAGMRAATGQWIALLDSDDNGCRQDKDTNGHPFASSSDRSAGIERNGCQNTDPVENQK